jgi:eukaryotic-like serine/threonine-protein kinase
MVSPPVLHLKQFGRYEIIRKLGRSMTDVYLALDPAVNRRTVLKIVEQCHDPLTQAVVDAERRGAIIQQQLHAIDPRILEVYEYGEQDGCFFVAMQYAEGKSLAEILRHEGRLDPVRAARYAAEVASQLSTLHTFQAEIDGHRHAVVHGDIKPANVQAGPNGEIWLLDFGIAKAITLTRNQTHHNLGSPGYCSPERLRKAQVDPHADLWALGVSLYEMVAGLPPYQAQSTRKLENLIQSRRPPRALPESCPAALRAVILKALAADSERRYPSAADFEADLRSFLDRKPTLAESERQPAWEANETLEKPRVESRPVRVAKSLSRFIPEVNSFSWAVVTGLALGLVCFVFGSYWYRYWSAGKPLRAPRDYVHATKAQIVSDWQLFKKLERRAALPGLAPAIQTGPLRAALLAAANDVLDRYRNSSDPAPADFDWDKARTALSYSIELDNSDLDAKGKLAVCNAYIRLLASPVDFPGVRNTFEEALMYLPRSPDPHLGLARVYVYGIHNAGRAMAELHAAEQLGFRPGPRESEQKGDAYLYRGELEMRVWQKAGDKAATPRYFTLSERDFARARSLYEPIAGFSNVDQSLDRLDHDEDLEKQIQAAREKARQQRAARARRLVRYRRWQ